MKMSNHNFGIGFQFLILIALLQGCGSKSPYDHRKPLIQWDMIQESNILQTHRGWSVIPHFYPQQGRIRSGILVISPNKNQFYFTGLRCGYDESLELLWEKGTKMRDSIDRAESAEVKAFAIDFFCSMDSLGVQAIKWHNEGTVEVFCNRGDSTYNEILTYNPRYHDLSMENPEILEEYGDENYPFVFVYLENPLSTDSILNRIAEGKTVNSLNSSLFYYRHFVYSRSSSLELYQGKGEEGQIDYSI